MTARIVDTIFIKYKNTFIISMRGTATARESESNNKRGQGVWSGPAPSPQTNTTSLFPIVIKTHSTSL